MYIRSAGALLKEALSISPAALLFGSQQVGKSTRCLALPKPVTLDEIQKAPELLESIKMAIDANIKEEQERCFSLFGKNGWVHHRTKDTYFVPD